jgi:Mg-chelatase subunit ChlD/sugar lactone lactonase YvrE
VHVRHPRPIAVLLIALCAFGLFPSPATPSAAQPGPPRGSYVAVETWTASAATIPAGLWADPAGLDLLPSGDVVVSDARFARVELLAADGSARVALRAGLAAPGHVAASEASDRIFVADAGASAVAVFRLDGTSVATWPGIGGVAGIAVAPDGRVALSDTDGNHVRWFEADGTPGPVWGGTGAGPGQLDDPAGLFVDAHGRVYVADRGKRRVVIFAPDGSPAGTISTDSGALAGADPQDVHVDGDDLWVASEAGLGRFDIGTRRLTGTLTGVDARAVTGHSRQGLLAAVVPGDGDPGVWRWRHRQASGDPVETWGGPLTVPGYFDGVEAISIGADGAAYVVDVPPRVQRYALDGSPQAQIIGPDLVQVDADAAGRVYAVAEDGTVHAFAADGSERWTARLRVTGVSAADLEPAALAWDAATAELLVLEAVSGDVLRFDDAGDALGSWSPSGGAGSKTRWADLKVGPNGTRYGLDVGGSAIRGWDASGATLLDLALPDAARGAERLTLLPDDSLAVLTRDGWGFRLARDGGVLAIWEAARLDLGDSRPADIAADASGRLYVTDRGVNVVTVFAWDPDAPRAEPLSAEEGCVFDGLKQAAPTEIELGEEVEITLSVRGACAATRDGVDVAVIIDTSMSRGSTRAVRGSIERMLALLTPGVDQVAIYGGLPARLSGDTQLVRRMLRRVELGQEDWLLLPPLQAAAGELYGSRGRREARKVILLLMASDGLDDNADFPWLRDRARREIEREAGQVKRRGAEIFGIWFAAGGPGRADGERMLADIVTSRDHLFDGGSERILETVFARVVERVKPTSLLSVLELSDELPPNMIYVAGSSAPPAEVAQGSLRWRLTDVPVVGTGVRFRVRPSEAGDWPTNLRAFADATTPDGQVQRIDFPLPRVSVRARPTPAPSNTPPPTETSRPLATATTAPTATTEPTPTLELRPLFLPVALREHCPDTRLPFDVALLIDSSNSMAGAPLEAASAAAQGFVDAMRLPRDRVAIVTFNARGTIRLPLTGDAAAVRAALVDLSDAVAAGTRLDDGLRAAHLAVAPGPADRPADRVPVIVLLTDGRQEEDLESPVDLASRMRDDGIEIRVIGLGEAIDEPYLQRVAGDASAYLRAPSADELAVVFRRLAEAFGLCPRERFWGKR